MPINRQILPFFNRNFLLPSIGFLLESSCKNYAWEISAEKIKNLHFKKIESRMILNMMTNISNRILIIDDDSTALDLMKDLLEGSGYIVDAVLSAEKGLNNLKNYGYKVLITDLKMPGMDGIELLDFCNKNYPELPVIILTAHGSIQNAVEALKIGAFDYLTKPIQMEELTIVIDKAITHQKLKIQNIFLAGELSRQEEYFSDSKNKKYQNLIQTIDTLKDVSSTVLLYGETGTGKEVLARLIHKQSLRSSGSFVPINCGAIPENLIESELFGYEKGAFTDAKSSVKGKLEIADGGTLFLDEIEELPSKAQVALLRFIQEREIIPLGSNRKVDVDVRIIVATNKDLKMLIKEKRFREDLYYRLSVFPLTLPTLRERVEDIEPLAEWFLLRFCAEYARRVCGFTDEAKKALLSYNWPGNIRELRNCIERAIIIEKEDRISRESLLLPHDEPLSIKFDSIGLMSLKELEDYYINWVLDRFDGNKTAASEKLGISLRGLRYKTNR